MAVSGAAASSNMGAQSIKALTPTLAILNIRLGYWLRNPSWVAKGGTRNIWANFYFLLELFGRLNERRKSVYLTDGGHIENLGIYELLKRRCGVIIAIDAEADPEMAFGSFNTLVRYARIDLGVEIDLPWQQITDVNREISNAMDDHGDCPKLKGPHCAIAEISFPSGRKGILIYIKSSLTGDENDYVFHYRKRYSRFPHETTVDQMFSEEQFEAYRALGRSGCSIAVTALRVWIRTNVRRCACNWLCSISCFRVRAPPACRGSISASAIGCRRTHPAPRRNRSAQRPVTVRSFPIVWRCLYLAESHP